MERREVPQVPGVALRVTFDARVPGTVCRFDLEPYSEKSPFDAIVVTLGEASKQHLVKCLIIGLDTDDFEVKGGELYELPFKELKPFMRDAG